MGTESSRDYYKDKFDTFLTYTGQSRIFDPYGRDSSRCSHAKHVALRELKRSLSYKEKSKNLILTQS